MAVHKVPQDVEADDKFLGPFSFKQFLFVGGTAICGYLTVLTLTKIWPVSFIFAIPTILFGALAFPWSKEQPTELFLASRIRFLIKPRKRIWNQSGVKELVNITVPVRKAHIYSDGLSQHEVRSRLSALATMVDSRGWAVKNIHSTYTNDADNEESDRLVSVQPVADPSAAVVAATPDVFDDSTGTIARQFDTMIEKSEQERKSATMKLVEDARARARQKSEVPATLPSQSSQKTDQDYWFLNSQQQPTDPNLATFQVSSVIAPGQQPTPLQVQVSDNNAGISEQQLLENVHKKQEREAIQRHPKHEKIINPQGTATPQLVTNPKSEIRNQKESTNTMTPPANPDILNLARSNDLSVETLARQANKKKDFGDDEVVISLR